MKKQLYFLSVCLFTTSVLAQGQSNEETITYVHEEASFMSRFVQKIIGLTGIKKMIEKKMKKKDFSQEAAAVPKSLQNNFDVKISEKNGHRYWTLKPKQNISDQVIMYMHGGAYILNMSRSHWELIEKLLIKTQATIVVPDYPLAPNSNCLDAYSFIEALYLELLSTVSPKNIILMGDSAGGGLALGFAQKLRNDNQSPPSQIILISPWLDITMSNPAIIEVDKKDKILGIKGLQMAGESYAGDIDTKDFKVSPIYGDFSGLGKISMFIGTNDLFIADTRKLKNLLAQKNIPVNYFEYPKMFHVWVIVTGLKESKHAINQMASLIKNEAL